MFTELRRYEQPRVVLSMSTRHAWRAAANLTVMGTELWASVGRGAMGPSAAPSTYTGYSGHC